MELVEQDGGHAAEEGIGEEAPRQHALGHEAHAGARARGVLEADRVADGLAHALAELLGDASCREPRRKAPWLEHHELAGHHVRVEHGARYACGLAGAGGRLEHERYRFAEGADDLGENRIDGEGSERRREGHQRSD